MMETVIGPRVTDTSERPQGGISCFLYVNGTRWIKYDERLTEDQETDKPTKPSWAPAGPLSRIYTRFQKQRRTEEKNRREGEGEGE